MNRFTALLVAAALAVPLFARATQTENHGIHAVPAPGKITIDGDLRDWDLSGQTLMCYDIETLRDVYSATVAMMYDADNLYIALHWKAPRPMSNSHDPHYQAAKGWAGDAVQLRVKTDEISHVTGWYYAAKKEPAIQIEHGKGLDEPFGGFAQVLYQTEKWKMTGGAEMAFAEDADKKGYVQEMKLPWKLITEFRHYKAGATFACGFDLLWGSADWPTMRYSDNLQPGKSDREFFWTAKDAWGPVTLEPKGHLKLPTPDYLTRALQAPGTAQGPIAIAYDLPKASRVTLAIDDTQGRRIRNLLAAAPRKAGRNVEQWNGLDDEGRPVSPGKYAVKILTHQGIHLNYALSFNSPGNPPWATPDGRGAFYGDHTAPQAVAAGGAFVGLACPIGEGGQPVIACDLTGQKLWGQANRTAFDGGHIALATDGKILYVASEGKQSVIYRDNIADGTYSPWNQTATDERGNAYNVLDLVVSDLPGMGAESHPSLNLSAIAVGKGILAVCLARENQVKILDAQTGLLKYAVSVPNPKAVVIDSAGVPIVLANGRLYELFPRVVKSVKVTQKVIDGLAIDAPPMPDAYGLALDSNDTIYVSVRGAEQNVKVLAPTGKLLREIGRRGGRPLHGAYDAHAMRNPAAIAIDSKNRLWVTEETDNPKRTSVWSADGKLLLDLAGSGHYSAAGSLDPYDKTLAYSDDTVFKLNWQTGKSRPIYSLHAAEGMDGVFPPHVHSNTTRIIKHGNDELFYTPDEFGGVVQCTIQRGGEYRSAARIGTVGDPEELRRSPYPDAAHKARYTHPVFAGHIGEVYAWADRNGDGIPQSDEMTFAKLEYQGKPVRLQSFAWGTEPGDDGAVTYLVRDAKALIQFTVSGYTDCGAPIYDVSHPRFVPMVGPNAALLGGGNGEGMIRGGADGRVYLNQDPIITVDKDGRVSGGYPSHFTSVHGSHSARQARPGYMIGPSSIAGVVNVSESAGEVFDMNGNLGEHYLMTQDGLLVQTLFKDLRGGYQTPERAERGVSFDANTAGGESFGANFTQTPDGKTYLTIGGTSADVLEVTGLDTLKRLPTQTVSVTPRQAELALRQAQTRAQTANSTGTKTFVLKETGNYKPGEARQDQIRIDDGPDKLFGTVTAAYRPESLSLTCRVYSAHREPMNGGQDDRLLFETGDAIDLMLAPMPGEKSPPSPLRLLVTMQNDAGTAILYRQTVAGTKASQRVAFASPGRTVYFDSVAAVEEVSVHSERSPGGYEMRVDILWRALGITPRPGLKMKADFGILFADEGGKVTVSRQYWNNKATGLVNDVPGEAELTPDLWGTLILK